METAKSIQDIKSFPFFSQFTNEQILQQVKKSKEGLELMRARAVASGKKYAGFTVAQLDEMIENYRLIIESTN